MSILKYASWGFAFIFAISLFGEDADKSAPNVQTAYKKTALPKASPPKPAEPKKTTYQPAVKNISLQPKAPQVTANRTQPTSETRTRPAQPSSSQPISVPSPYGPIILLQPTTMYVDANRLNVRNAPTRQAKVIWTLKRDEAVQVLTGWGMVGTEGEKIQWMGLWHLSHCTTSSQINAVNTTSTKRVKR